MNNLNASYFTSAKLNTNVKTVFDNLGEIMLEMAKKGTLR